MGSKRNRIILLLLLVPSLLYGREFGDVTVNGNLTYQGSVQQDVSSGSSPTLDGTNITGINADNVGDGATNAIPTLTQESNWDTHLSDTTDPHGASPDYSGTPTMDAVAEHTSEAGVSINGLTIHDTSRTTDPLLTVNRTVSPTDSQAGYSDLRVNRTGGQQGNAQKFDYRVSAELTTGFDIPDTILGTYDWITGGKGLGQWYVVSSPRDPAKFTDGGVRIGEWNILERSLLSNTIITQRADRWPNTGFMQLVPMIVGNVGNGIEHGGPVDYGFLFAQQGGTYTVVNNKSDLVFDSATKTITSTTTDLGDFRDGEQFTVSGTVSNNGTFTVNGDNPDHNTITTVEALTNESPASCTIVAAWQDATLNVPIINEEDAITPDGYFAYLRGGSDSDHDPVAIIKAGSHWQNGIDLSGATLNATDAPALKLAANQSIMWGTAKLSSDGTGLSFNNVLDFTSANGVRWTGAGTARINTTVSGSDYRMNIGYASTNGAGMEAYQKDHSTRPGQYRFVYGGGAAVGKVVWLRYNGSAYPISMLMDENNRTWFGVNTSEQTPQAQVHVDGDIIGGAHSVIKTATSTLNLWEVRGTKINNAGETDDAHSIQSIPDIDDYPDIIFSVFIGSAMSTYDFCIKAAADNKFYLDGAAGADNGCICNSSPAVLDELLCEGQNIGSSSATDIICDAKRGSNWAIVADNTGDCPD